MAKKTSLLKDLRNKNWEYKYRPQKLRQVLLPEETTIELTNYIKSGSIPNLILHSASPGTGKTSTALAIANDLGAEVLFIKASEDGNVETVRSEINSFGRTMNLEGKPKIVILDEADGRGGERFQEALKGAIEAHEMTTRFILTCNDYNKIITPLKSRCNSVSYNIKTASNLREKMMERLTIIANTEVGDIGEVSTETISQICDINFPDMRAMIRETQRCYERNSGSIIGDIRGVTNAAIQQICELLTQGEKGWKQARKIFIEEIENPYSFCTEFLDYAFDNLPENHHLAIAVAVAEAERWGTQQVNPDINIACGLFPELMRIFNG